MLWCVGMVLFAVRFAYQVGCLLAAKREIEPVNRLALNLSSRTSRAVRIGLSDRIAVPCLLGMFKPVIVLPRALACELSDADLQRVVLHEAAHLQRGDDWFNLVEPLALVILFFNPAIHLIARRIEIEREIACDDSVIATMQNRLTYAQFLTGLARRTSTRQAVIVPGFFTNRRQIFVRIEQLLDRRHNGSSIIGRKAVLALGLLSMAAVALAQVDIPVLAAACTVPAKPPIVSRQRVLAVIRAVPPAAVKPVRAVHVGGGGGRGENGRGSSDTSEESPQG
ncbi:MAG: M56 family metallopeptidase [Candidatus Eremiobacter antarcticus]|nr:M56 family metallopeptidase [Candidatus Eremiobacteraeota bacterium]